MKTTSTSRFIFEELGEKHLISSVSPKVGSKNIMSIGRNSEKICDKLGNDNFVNFSVNDFQSAMEWLLNLADNTNLLPKAIVYDIDIKNDTPFQNIEALKKLKFACNIPIILITSTLDTDEREKALKAGADDYYTTSVSKEDLKYRILFLNKVNELVTTTVEKSMPAEQLKLKKNFLKRAFDLSISIPLLIMLSPVFIIVAILIRLDSKGPIFYVSKRAGTGYKIFNFYKFRTMKIGADKELEKLKHKNQYSDNDDALFFKIEKDPRITKIGSFLRNSSLDELPQILNVIKGDMSLVGNRPLPLYEATRLTKDQWAMRFHAPAGITGLWQVTKRGQKEMSEEERIHLDIAYARMNSFLYDIKILIKTIPAAFQKENV